METILQIISVLSDAAHVYFILLGLLEITKFVILYFGNEENQILKLDKESEIKIGISLTLIIILIINLHLGFF